MDSITLPRTGLPPLRFTGEVIAEVDGFRVNTREQTRWHDLTVYRTQGGQFVLQILYRSNWAGEVDHSTVFHSLTSTELIDRLDDYSPLEHIQGYPPTDAFADRQRRLEDDIERRFRHNVTELYALLPAEWFTEEIA